MTKVYLIRHAEAEGNLYRRIHGQYDSLITPNGRKQIKALRERFLSIPVDACYSSDLIRTRLTATAICEPKQLALQVDPRLRELGLGRWEDVPFGWVEHVDMQNMLCFNEDPEHWHTEDAERYEDCCARMLAAMTQAAEAHDGGTVCLVSHGSAIRNVLLHLFFPGQPEKVGHSDNAAVTRLEYDAGTWRLCYQNDNSHLDERISTLAQQRWWREGGQAEDFNLWFRLFDGDHDVYCALRADAWQTIYGSLDGFSAEGFYQELMSVLRYHPEAAAYAMLGGRVAGFIQLSPTRKREQGIGYINLVYLGPDFRGKGIGAQLIGYAVSTYRAQGRHALQLGVAEGNLRAQRFYAKLGFRQVGTTPGLNRDLRLLQLDIDRTPYL